MTNPVSFAEHVNALLKRYPDKEWNYSRITLTVRSLDSLATEYVLWPDSIDPRNAAGRESLKSMLKELAWGDRHSSELGILELISLRLNRALVELTGGLEAVGEIPVIRVVPRQSIQPKTAAQVLWYEVIEVSGEDFDSR